MKLFGKKEAASKDHEAQLIAVIQEHQEQFYRIAYSYVKNEHDALDVVQEAIVKAIKNSHQIKEASFIKSWFVRILINSGIDHRRKMSQMVFSEDLEITNPKAMDAFGEEASKKSPEEMMDLRQAIEGLESQQRIMIELRYFEDLPLQEIANILELPLGTVKSTLYRTLKHLRLALEEDEYVEA